MLYDPIFVTKSQKKTKTWYFIQILRLCDRISSDFYIQLFFD